MNADEVRFIVNEVIQEVDAVKQLFDGGRLMSVAVETFEFKLKKRSLLIAQEQRQSVLDELRWQISGWKPDQQAQIAHAMGHESPVGLHSQGKGKQMKPSGRDDVIAMPRVTIGTDFEKRGSKFVCIIDNCAKEYKYRTNTIYHVLAVHRQIRFKCSNCYRRYRYKYDLRRHLKKVHEVLSEFMDALVVVD